MGMSAWLPRWYVVIDAVGPCSRQSDIETSNMTLLKLHDRFVVGHDDICYRAWGPPVRVRDGLSRACTLLTHLQLSSMSVHEKNAKRTTGLPGGMPLSHDAARNEVVREGASVSHGRACDDRIVLQLWVHMHACQSATADFTRHAL